MNIITFGKYKGMSVTRVLRIDPSYFGWCFKKDCETSCDKVCKKHEF